MRCDDIQLSLMDRDRRRVEATVAQSFIVPADASLRSIVCTAGLPVDLGRFQRKLDAGRWRGWRKRRNAERRLARLRRDEWLPFNFTFGSLPDKPIPDEQ